MVTRGRPRDPTKRYIGKPCPHGHSGERYVSGGVCVECTDSGAKKRRLANKAKYQARVTAYARKRKFGLSDAEYLARVAAQGGRCAICGGVSAIALAVDHDHSCCPGKSSCGKCIRGLLCSACNTALGQFRDNPALLRKAAAYVESYVR